MRETVKQHDRGSFTFAANNDVNAWFSFENGSIVIGGIHATVYSDHVRAGCTDGSKNIDADIVCRRRTGMTDHHHIGSVRRDLFSDSGGREMQRLGIKQTDIVTSIDQWPTDHQQTERNLMTNTKLARQRLVRRIDKRNPHANLPSDTQSYRRHKPNATKVSKHSEKFCLNRLDELLTMGKSFGTRVEVGKPIRRITFKGDEQAVIEREG